MEPVPKMVIATRLATRKGQIEVGTPEEIEQLISQLIIAKVGLAGAASAISAQADRDTVIGAMMDGARRVEAERTAQATPGQPETCWCAHSASVHNVVASGGGRGFCTECSPGRCGRYEAAKPPVGASVAHAAEPGLLPMLTWTLSADGTGWTTTRLDGLVAVVEPLDDGKSFLPRVGAGYIGPVFEELPAAADWAVQYIPPLASCGHPADEDGECGCSSWPERAVLASVTPLPLRPDYEVIPELQKPCNEAHPSKGTLCTGKIPHPMPHVDEDGTPWDTTPLAVSS